MPAFGDLFGKPSKIDVVDREHGDPSWIWRDTNVTNDATWTGNSLQRSVEYLCRRNWGEIRPSLRVFFPLFQLFQNRTELHQQGEYKHFIRGHYKTHISYIYCYWLCLMYLCLFFCLSVNSSTTSIITYYHVFNRPFIGVFLGPSSATQGPFRCIFVQKQVEISTHSSLSVLEEFCS